jgi:hypothetical protein
MGDISILSDLDECRKVWKKMIPQKGIFDLWESRMCFYKYYKKPLYFIVSKKDGEIGGLLPLCLIEEEKGNYYGYFPGETWEGKTWLEENKIIAKDEFHAKAILDYLNNQKLKYAIRYLSPNPLIEMNDIDELGYLFLPKHFDYNIDNYFKIFSRTSIKSIKKDIAKINSGGVSYRFNHLEDFDLIIKWSLERYKEHSYFSEPAFLDSFKDFMHLLNEKKLLRLTTVLVDSEPAAVDIGCLFKNQYTLLGGGTNAKFLGIAKLINLFHIEKACKEKIKKVDFLCGDFSWKKMFHLTPRPLYVLSNLTK